MRRKYCYIITLLTGAVLLLAGPAAAQAPPLPDLFEKMRNAGHEYQVSGIMDVEVKTGDRVERFSKRISIRPPLHFDEELILSEEQKAQIEQMKNRRPPERGERSGRGERPRWDSGFRYNRPAPFHISPVHTDLLQRNYTVTVEPSEPVAGRDAWFLSITPKIEKRPTNRLWIDRETGIILKRELVEQRRDRARVFTEYFTEIEIAEVDREEMRIHQEEFEQRMVESRERYKDRDVSINVYESTGDIPPDVRKAVFIPDTMPGGFTLQSIRQFTEKGHTSFTQTYSDGLLIATLFQMKGDMKDEFERYNKMRRGRNQNDRITLFKQDGDRGFMLVGYLQFDLLREIFNELPGEEIDRRR